MMNRISQRFGEWWRDYWRPMCGFTYLLICIFDFLVMPLVYTAIYRKEDLARIINLTENLQAQAQASALPVLIQSKEWKPITLQEGALFHVAFGAILTGAAITRGLTQSNLARAGRDPWHFYHNPAVDDYQSEYQYNKYNNNNHNYRYEISTYNMPRNRNVDNPDA